jgi:hypothetical protein
MEEPELLNWRDEQTRRSAFVVLSLGFAFIAMMWAPFEWIQAFLADSGSPFWSGKAIAERLRYVWPIVVGTLISSAYVSYRSNEIFRGWRDVLRGGIFPLCTMLFVISISILLGYAVIVLMALSVGIFLFFPFFLLWCWLVYRALRSCLSRLFGRHLDLSGTLLERASLFAAVAIPQCLCLFGLMMEPEWFFTFP